MEDQIEKTYVASFYNSNATEFSQTRRKPWIVTKRFVEENTSVNSLVLDNGCGNGRGMVCKMVGLDSSLNLLEHASSKSSHGLINGTGLLLPFSDDSFDLVLSVAVIHHFCTAERREIALREMFRVMKSKSKAFVSVWAESVKTLKKAFRADEVCSRKNDVLVSWKGDKCNARYYHLFEDDELDILVKKVGFLVIRSWLECENYYIVVEKP